MGSSGDGDIGPQGAQSPADVLAEFETRWARDVRGVNLLAELDPSQQELQLVLRCLGIVWRQAGSAARAKTLIRATYPACMVIATSGSASMYLKGGKVLPDLIVGAGLNPSDPNLGQSWGELFRDCLATLGLPEFPELDQQRAKRFVSRMLLHGGIPLDQLGTWLDLVTDAAERLPGATGSEIQSWLIERIELERLYEATTTLRRFIQHGAEFAADVIDRSLDLIDRLQSDDGGPIDVGLPQRYVTTARELDRGGRLASAAGRRAQHGVSQDLRPHVTFDPFGLGVAMILPSVSSPGGVEWVIDLGGPPQRVVLGVHGLSGRTPEREIAVPMGVAEIAVRRNDSTPVTLQVVPRDEPLLVFDERGRLLPRSAALPRGPVWCIAPVDRELEFPGGHELARPQSVPRWSGWHARESDLRDAGRLQLMGSLPRRIQSGRSAVLDGLRPLPGLTVDGGGMVLGAWPELVLPVGAGPFDWRITLEPVFGDGSAVVLERHVADEDVRVPLGPLGQQVVGIPVRLSARGPLGSDLRQVITVLEGARLTLSPPLRAAKDGSGLDPCRIHLEFASSDLGDVVLGPEEESARFTLSHGIGLIVTPPTVSFEQIAEGRVVVRRHTPITVLRDVSGESLGSLLVRVPGATSFSLDLLGQDGQLLQRLEPSGVADRGAALFHLDRARGVLDEHAVVYLQCITGVWQGRAGVVKRARMASEAVPDANRRMVQFFGVATGGVLAGWYPRYAPGSPVVVTDVKGGDTLVVVPGEVADLGPLRVLLQPRDPWVQPEWPVFPSARATNCFDLHFPVPAVRDERAPFARQLAGEEPFPEVLRDPTAALRILLHLDHLGTAASSSMIRRELGRLLDGRDAAIIAHLGELGSSSSELAALSCSVGLVARELPATIPDDTIEILWARWEGLAGLLTAAQLKDPMACRAALRLLEARCGPNVERLVRGESVDELSLPKFDEAHLLSLPRAALEQIRRVSGIFPRGLLHADARAEDGFELVFALAERENESLHAIAQQEQLLLSRAQVIYGQGAPAPLLRGIRQRLQGAGIQAVPAVSLALAAAARTAARGTGVLPPILAEALATLAVVRPALVAADLIMAELTLVAGEIDLSDLFQDNTSHEDEGALE